LDEPTSGLDSLSAWSIVRLLRKLADSGQAILCTIHQPSSLIFEQFDRLLLLATGGKPVYFGEIGEHSRTVLQYFESHGGAPCGTDSNPAEHILDVIGAGSNSATKTDWNEIWTKTEGCQQVVRDIKKLQDDYAVDHKSSQGDRKVRQGDFAEPWWTQYRAFQSRLYLHYWRSPPYVMGKIMLNVVAGLFLGFTFYKEDSSVQGLQNKVRPISSAGVGPQEGLKR
jgi:ATP-binding cassette subfamily G (WHITE) protein 2 (SNQ2)